jgi:hypothetical protein
MKGVHNRVNMDKLFVTFGKIKLGGLQSQQIEEFKLKQNLANLWITLLASL